MGTQLIKIQETPRERCERGVGGAPYVTSRSKTMRSCDKYERRMIQTDQEQEQTDDYSLPELQISSAASELTPRRG